MSKSTDKPSTIYRSAQVRELPTKPADTASNERVFQLVASTQDLDSHDSIVEASWDLKRYLENPIVLWDHNMTFDSGTLPIGTMRKLEVNKDNQLVGELVLASEKANPRAEQVFQLIKEGILRGVSVGFYPRDVRYEKHDGRQVLVLSNNELREISLTPVPSNPNTLIQLRSRAAERKPVMDKDKKKDGATQKRGAAPLSDPAAIEYILGAVDESSIPDDQKQPLKDAIKARFEECMQAGEAESADSEAKTALESILKTVGTKTAEAAVLVIEGLQERVAGIPKTEKNLETERTKTMLDEARRAGKLTPAIEKKPSWQQVVKRGYDAMKEAIDLLEPQSFVRSDDEDKEPEIDLGAITKSGPIRLTSEDEEMIRREKLDPKKFLEHKKSLAKQGNL